MRIIVIGAVAGGTSAATKARRNDEHAEIVIYEKGRDISYSGCGMPYYLGGEVEERGELIPREPNFFKKIHNIDIKTGHEVLKIDSKNKTVLVRSLTDNSEFLDHYDKLVIATGARARVLKVKGGDLPHVFSLRTIVDMDKIASHLQKEHLKDAVVIGSGYIGLEMVDSLTRQGLRITILEKADQIIPSMDGDMAQYVRSYLEDAAKIKVETSVDVQEITSNKVIYTKDGKTHEVPADIVISSIGVIPNVEIALEAGVKLGTTNAIKTDERLETNIKDIYATGDVAEVWHIHSKKPLYRPMGSTANKTGRIVGDNITGGDEVFKGVLGTAIFKLFDMSAAQTGKTEKEAIADGDDYVVAYNIKPDRPHFMGGRDMVIKALALKDGTIIGAQIVGYEGVDKRIDVISTTITFKGKAKDLEELDLAYAPPFATARDPIIYTGMILENHIKKNLKLQTPKELLQQLNEKVQIIDIRSPLLYRNAHIEGAINIPQQFIRDNINALDKDKPVILYCMSAWTSNAVQNILIQEKFKDVKNVTGGYVNIANYIRSLKK